MIRKRIPRNEENFDLMLQNMSEKCPNYQAALNLSNAQLATLSADATSYHDWRLAKNQIADAKVSVTEFVKTLFTGDKDAPLPQTPVVDLGSPVLPEKPGIEPRTERFIELLEAQDNFTDAIGLDLGFYENVGEGIPSDQKTAAFDVADLSNYELKITFSRQGLSGLLLKYRTKGADAWTSITLTSSPYTLQITPDPNGNAVTLEMQGFLIEDNKPVGQPSDIKTVIAHA